MPYRNHETLLIGVLVGASTLIVTLAWNDLFRDLFERLNPKSKSWMGKLLYAILATVFVLGVVVFAQHMLPDDVDALQLVH